MSFCAEPWAANMPARTKAQRAAKLKRALEERGLHAGCLKHILDLANERRAAMLAAEDIAFEMRVRGA